MAKCFRITKWIGNCFPMTWSIPLSCILTHCGLLISIHLWTTISAASMLCFLFKEGGSCFKCILNFRYVHRESGSKSDGEQNSRQRRQQNYYRAHRSRAGLSDTYVYQLSYCCFLVVVIRAHIFVCVVSWIQLFWYPGAGPELDVLLSFSCEKLLNTILLRGSPLYPPVLIFK